MKGGGAQNVSTLQKRGGRGAQKVYPVLWGGGGGGAQTNSDPQFSHFVAPLPVINYQSLRLRSTR